MKCFWKSFFFEKQAASSDVFFVQVLLVNEMELYTFSQNSLLNYNAD